MGLPHPLPLQARRAMLRMGFSRDTSCMKAHVHFADLKPDERCEDLADAYREGEGGDTARHRRMQVADLL